MTANAADRRTAWAAPECWIDASGVAVPIRAVAFDFDGVMTDNRVIVLPDGTEAIIADRSDGMGVAMLRQKTALELVVLSTETDTVVGHRCRKMQLAYQQGLEDKAAALDRWFTDVGVDASEAIYVGNDVNDIDCMRMSGWAVAPADAYPAALAEADLVLSRPGGRGAVRELAEILLRHPGTVGGPAAVEAPPREDSRRT